MTPLFIPLKTEFYEKFARGEKTSEFRLYGDRWNEDTCPIGRPVTLSKGYGAKYRLASTVKGFFTVPHTILPPGDKADVEACYGPGPHKIAVIALEPCQQVRAP